MELFSLGSWRSHVTSIGARYCVMWLAEGDGAVNADTEAELRRVLGLRRDLKILDTQNLGRVIRTDIEVRASAPILSITGERTATSVAGTRAVMYWKVANVMGIRVDPNDETLLQATLGWLNPFDWSNVGTAWNWGQQVANNTVDAAVDAVTPDVDPNAIGRGIGEAIASAIKPLIIPAIVIFAAYTLIDRKV